MRPSENSINPPSKGEIGSFAENKRNFQMTSIAVLVVVLSVPFNVIVEAKAADISVHGNDTVRILVRLKENNSVFSMPRDRQSAVKNIKQISAKAPRNYLAKNKERRAPDLRRWRVMEVELSQAAAILGELQTNPVVAEARLEQLYQSTAIPNDPLFNEQYGLYDTKNPLADINAVPAWGKSSGSASNIIAIIDGGVDLTHEDLKDKIWINNREVADNRLDDDGNGFVDDLNGWDFVDDVPAKTALPHATHVAGLAAASSNNGRGVAGVDWQARLMSIRALNNYGIGREADIAAGINYAAANGAKIINLSIAGSQSAVIQNAIENAYAAGVVVVAAAGNSGRDTTIYQPSPVCAEPADVNMVLGVGATDDQGKPASFSNYGRCVDISAPGKRIISAVPGNKYQVMTGTSMSAPLAAGVASLYLSLHPNASPAEVINAVSQGSPFVGSKAEAWNANFKGKLDAAKVLGVAIDENPGEPLPPSPSPSSTPLSPPNLSIAASGPVTANVGDTINYDIKVTNNGSTAALGIVMENKFDRDSIPINLPANCQLDRSTVKCNQTSLPAGSEANFRLEFKINISTHCSSSLYDYSYVYAQERGNLRRQARSDRVNTEIICP